MGEGGKVVERVCRQRKAPGRIKECGALWALLCCSGSFSKRSPTSKGEGLCAEQAHCHRQLKSSALFLFFISPTQRKEI